MPSNPIPSDCRITQGGIQYPNPFFDIASTYVPPTVKTLFRFTKYFYYSNSTISPIIYKLSEYPVTRIVYERDQAGDDISSKTESIWKKMMEDTLHIQRLQIEINLDYNVFGNAFLSISYPFKRYLECPLCKKKTGVNKVNWKWRKYSFQGNCPKCRAEDITFKVVDLQVKNRKMINIVRWNPMNISIEHNPITGKSTYMYHIPNTEKKAITLGKKGHVDTVPWVFIEAVKKKKQIELEPENLFHFKRPNISDQDMGWGLPIIVPVIKDAYYAQVLRKGQEAIANGHIVPLRILFPESNADTSPYATMNLGSWKTKIEGELAKWRQDPNYISIMPIPIGQDMFGGTARNLNITPELKLTQQQIAGGMGVPLEFVTGGMNWTGSSITLRMLENHFLTIIKLHDEFLSWLTLRMARFFRLPKVHCRQSNFKMADDVQYKQLMVSLQQSGNIAAGTLLKEHGLNFEEEQKKINKEQQVKQQINGVTQIQTAEVTGEMSVIHAKYNAIAQGESQKIIAMYQQEMQEEGLMQAEPDSGGQTAATNAAPSGEVPPGEGGSEQGQMTIPQMVDNYARQMSGMDDKQREVILSQMEASKHGSMPQLAAAIRDRLKEVAQKAVDMRPLPEKQAPRRKASPV